MTTSVTLVAKDSVLIAADLADTAAFAEALALLDAKRRRDGRALEPAMLDAWRTLARAAHLALDRQAAEPAAVLPETMTTASAAKVLGCTTRRVVQLIKATDLPAVKLDGRWILTRKDVERWMQERRKAT